MGDMGHVWVMCWSTIGDMGYVWVIHVSCRCHMGHVMYESYLRHICHTWVKQLMHGSCTGHVWDIHGSCVGHLWVMRVTVGSTMGLT